MSPRLELSHKGKSTPQVPQLVIGIQIRPQARYGMSLIYTKPVIIGPSAVFILVLSNVVAEAAWDPRGSYMSASFFLLFSPFLLSLSSLPLGRPAPGRGGGGGPAGDVAAAAAASLACAASTAPTPSRTTTTAAAGIHCGRHQGELP